MLTKKDRAAIAERIKSVGYVDEKTFYESIVDKCVPSTTSYSEDLKTIFQVVLDLCDTSNMVELPRDKDGEVIQVGDTVWRSGKKETVKAIEIRDSEARIHFVVPLGCESWSSPELITHKKPVTIASLVGEIRRTLSQSTISNKETTSKLWEITDQIEMLGDCDD